MAVREEGAAAAMRGLAGRRRVFTWQGRQTVQALGLFRARSSEEEEEEVTESDERASKRRGH